MGIQILIAVGYLAVMTLTILLLLGLVGIIVFVWYIFKDEGPHHQ